MTSNDESDSLRKQYSAAIGDYQAASHALMQFDLDLFNGPMLDLGTIVQEGQECKKQEEAAYRRLSRAREAYFHAS